MPLGRAGSIPAQRTKNRHEAVFDLLKGNSDQITDRFRAKYSWDYSVSFLIVLKLNGKYKGQKDTRLVKTKMMLKTSKMIPKIPLTVPLIYK